MAKYLNHRFFLRGFDKHLEMQILTNQLLNFGIPKENIIFVSNGPQLKTENHQVHMLSGNNGYQRGDIELLQKCFELSKEENINHYINWGTIIFDFNLFDRYLTFIESSNHNIFIPKGYNIKEQGVYESQNEYFVGCIFTIKKISEYLKNIFNDFNENEEVKIKQKYTLVGNKDEKLEIDTESKMWIEYFLFLKLQNQDVVFLKSHRGVVFEKVMLDYFVCGIAGMCRTNRNQVIIVDNQERNMTQEFFNSIIDNEQYRIKI